MELNKFTIGLILVALVVFVGAIAASDIGNQDDNGADTHRLGGLQNDVYSVNSENFTDLGRPFTWPASINESKVILGWIT